MGTAESLPYSLVHGDEWKFEDKSEEKFEDKSEEEEHIYLGSIAGNNIRQFFAASDPKSILQAATYLFGCIRHPLLGSVLSKSQLGKCFANFQSINEDSVAKDALQKMEIQLSLLYEALHTKLPVVVSKIGYICRALSLVCILGALLSFSLIKKHYKLEEFDAWLTYGLLIGALTLDLISIIQLVFSDWVFITNFHNLGTRFRLKDRFFKRRRWSNTVPQLNLVTYGVKDHPNWLKKLATFLPTGSSLLEGIKVFRCMSSQNFGKDLQYWHCIFEDVMEVLSGHLEDLDSGDLYSGEDKASFAETLLAMHVATELLIQEEDAERSLSESSDNDRTICKLISDYMFYLLMMEPAAMTTVSSNREKLIDDALSFLGRSSVSNERDATRKILSANFDDHEEIGGNEFVLKLAQYLAKQLKDGTVSWKIWRGNLAFLMCYAARKCRPNVHAQQPSKGGELLTFIWLCLAYGGRKISSN